MPALPLAIKSDPAKREVVSSERLVNLYAVTSPTEGRSKFYLNRTPGLTAWSLASSDLCRGLFNADTEGLGIYGSQLFRFIEVAGGLGGATSVSGSISGTGDVRWSQNNASGTATPYTFSTTVTDSDPGSGNVRFNNATFGSITTIFFDNSDADGNVATSWLDSFDDFAGGINGTLTATGDDASQIVFNVTGSVVDGTGYRKVTVSPVSGAVPANGAGLSWVFVSADSSQPSMRETVIVTGTTPYQYTNGTLKVIANTGLPDNPIDTLCCDGITLYLFRDGRVFYSAVNDADNVDPLSFFTVPGIGALVSGMMVGNAIIFFRENSFEVFRHISTDAESPFQLVSGVGQPFGNINTFANCIVGGIVCIIDQYGIPRTISPGGGFLPNSIGNEGVQTDIEALDDKSELRLWGYVSGDHGFLVIQSSAFCWVHDFKESRWHNRKSYQRKTWQARYAMRFANRDLVAPDQSGGLFYLDDSAFTEDGGHIVWEVVCPPVTNFPNGGTIPSINLDIEVGTALGASASAEDQEPDITMSKSINGGKTFGNGRQRSLGKRGEWRKRVTWNRCGDFGREGFILKFTGSGGTPNAILNLAADIQERAA